MNKRMCANCVVRFAARTTEGVWEGKPGELRRILPSETDWLPCRNPDGPCTPTPEPKR